MKKISFCGVAAVSVVIAVWLYKIALLPLASIGWDEGVHLLDAINVAVPVRNGSIETALDVSFGQFFYPPGYSWALAIWSLVGGVSTVNFRLWSLAAWVGSAVLVYIISLKLTKSVIAGIVAFGLFVTAPIYWIFGTEGMIEMTGVLATLGVVLLVLWADDEKISNRSIGRWALVGCGIAGLHFVKYNYAMWVIGGIVAEAFLLASIRFGIAGIGRPKGLSLIKEEFIRMAAMILPVVLMFVFWVVGPGRTKDYLHYFNDPNFYSYYVIPFWQHLVWFFPMAIANEYLASPWLVIVVAFAIAVAGKRIIRLRPLRIMAIIFVINFFFATIHFHNQQSRYVITSVPFLYILSGAGVIGFVEDLVKSRRRKVGLIAIVVLVILTGGDFLWNVNNVWRIGEHILSSPIYALSQYRDSAFDFDKSHWPSGRKLEETPQQVLEWILKNTDENKPLLYMGRANEVSPPALEYLRGQERLIPKHISAEGAEYAQYAVTLQVVPGSLIDTYDFRKMNKIGTEQGLAAVVSGPGWELVTNKDFTQLGVEVKIWGR